MSSILRLDRWQQRHGPTAFVVAVVKKFGEDRGGSLAALLTYYGFLSIFPLLLVFVTALRIVLRDNVTLQHDLLNSALADFPIVGTQLRKNLHGLSSEGIGLAIGLAVLLWGSMGVAQAGQHAMAEVWNVPLRDRPGFLPRLGRSVLFLLIIGTGVVGGAVLTFVAGHSLALEIAVIVLGVVFSGVIYLGTFRALTPSSIPTRDLRLGAAIGGAALTALQALGGYLIARQLRHTSELYGFFSIVLGLMAWLTFAAHLSMYAAEINVVRARRLWPRSVHQRGLAAAVTVEEIVRRVPLMPVRSQEGATMAEKMDDLKGRAKEAAGSLTNDKDLKREGKADQAAASVKDTVGNAVDAVKDKVEDLTHRDR